MPINQQTDFILNSKGYMLERGQYRGRAWHRTGRSDSPAQRTAEDVHYGNLPDEIDHAEVWNDWSGGYGDPIRSQGNNRYDWGENFDARFPGMLVHAQAMQHMQMGVSINAEGAWVRDVPLYTTGPIGGAGAGAVGIGLHNVDGFEIFYPNTGSGSDQFWTGFLGSICVLAPKKPPTGRPVTYGSYYYIPNSSLATTFWRQDLPDGATLVNPSGTLAPAGMLGHGFAVAGDKLWRFVNLASDKRAVVQNCADPDNTLTTTAWSATYNLGDRFSGARDMIAYEDQVFVGMADGLYAGDATGTFVNVTPDLPHGYSDVNFHQMTVHNGEIVFPHSSGLYAYDPSSGGVREISPSSVKPMGRSFDVGFPGTYPGPAGRGIPPTSPNSPASPSGAPTRVVGRFRAVHSYAGWLYVGLTTGSGVSHIVAGRESQAGWVWHPMQRLPHTTRIHRLHVDSAGYGSGAWLLPVRLWALTDATVYGGTLTATSPTYFHRIPNQNGNPLMDDGVFSANYTYSARLDFGSTDWGAPTTPKVYRNVEVWADNLASGYRYCDVYYTIDASSSRALLGRAQTSPKTILYFTASAANFVTGQSIQLSIESFIVGSFAITPIYRAIVLRGALRPKSVDTITAIVRVADGVPDRRGVPLRPGGVMLSELRALAQSAQAVNLIDLTGASNWVSVLSPVEEQEVYQQGMENPEVAATLRMAILSFTGQ